MCMYIISSIHSISVYIEQYNKNAILLINAMATI